MGRNQGVMHLWLGLGDVLPLTMPKQFTAAEQAIIAKASQDLYRYEKTCTEHSAILRRDIEALTKAQQEYKATKLVEPNGLHATP